MRVEVRAETETGPWIRYVYDPTGKSLRLLEEYVSIDHDTWTLRARYVHGVGLVSRIDADDNTKLYHYDIRGSTVALTNLGISDPANRQIRLRSLRQGTKVR